MAVCGFTVIADSELEIPGSTQGPRWRANTRDDSQNWSWGYFEELQPHCRLGFGFSSSQTYIVAVGCEQVKRRLSDTLQAGPRKKWYRSTLLPPKLTRILDNAVLAWCYCSLSCLHVTVACRCLAEAGFIIRCGQGYSCPCVRGQFDLIWYPAIFSWSRAIQTKHSILLTKVILRHGRHFLLFSVPPGGCWRTRIGLVWPDKWTSTTNATTVHAARVACSLEASLVAQAVDWSVMHSCSRTLGLGVTVG